METRRRALGRASGVLLASAAGAAVTGLWVGMSLATTLIWHLHPALPGIAAGWGFRRGLGRQGTKSEAATLTGLTALLVAVGGLVIAGADKSLDDAWFIAVVAAGGLAFGLWLLLRPPERPS